MDSKKRKWDLTKVFDAQETFENVAFANAGMDRETTQVHRRLAAIREITEFMDEMPAVYKFWKQGNKRPDFDRIMDELADVLHMITSLGIDINANPIHQYIEFYDTLQDQILAVFNWTGVCTNTNAWEMCMAAFRGLCEMLGVSEKEMIEAYMKKNAENHARQARGY